ncbi:MAG: TolC family protein [Bacteroidales bacterium]|nr:TolC family protein [Bacteroidales bacterium]
MSKKLIVYLFAILFFSVFSIPGISQTEKELTLDAVLEIARDQSPQSVLAKARFLGKYWSFRTFKAKYRPSLGMNTNLVDFNRALEKEYNFDTGEEYYVEKFSNNSQVALNLTQNVGFTGGTVFAQSSVRRFDMFGDNPSSQYITVPVSIGITQPLFQYNPLKWEKKIEPIKYEEAKKSYIDDVENVNQRAVSLFFNLALAQLNMEMAEINYSNSDTLYKIARGRYNIGTIAEDELLQMQLRFLNAGADLNQRQIDLQIQQFQLRSFLGYNNNVSLRLIVPDSIPELTVDYSEALALAYGNNPEIQNMDRQLIEAERDVAMAKGEKGLKADIFGSFGFTGNSNQLDDAYQSLEDQQRLRVGLSFPILDWGLGRGQLKVAQSNQEVIMVNVRQDRIDFDQSVFLSVAQFNFQDDQVQIAAKADTIAQKRFEVSKQRFYIGKIDVLDLNVADSEKDVARRNYISTLRNYWTDFYMVRRLALYDFVKQETLSADIDAIIE